MRVGGCVGVMVMVFVRMFVSVGMGGVRVVWVGVFGLMAGLKDIDLGGGDAAAIGLLDGEGGVEIESGDGLVEDFWRDA